jgi:hypothetical protein
MSKSSGRFVSASQDRWHCTKMHGRVRALKTVADLPALASERRIPEAPKQGGSPLALA